MVIYRKKYCFHSFMKKNVSLIRTYKARRVSGLLSFLKRSEYLPADAEARRAMRDFIVSRVFGRFERVKSGRRVYFK